MDVWEESVSGRGKSKCKGPEVRNELVKKATVAGAGGGVVAEAASHITPDSTSDSNSSVFLDFPS